MCMRIGLYQDLTDWKVNFNYLEEQDYFKLFEHEKVLVPAFQMNLIEPFVNKVIRNVIVEHKSRDRQISFIADTRNKRRCTDKQLHYLEGLLEKNFDYTFNKKQLQYISKQPICVVSDLIGLFKDTELVKYHLFEGDKEFNKKLQVRS